MKEMNIRSILRRKFVVTTDSNQSNPIAENVLDRDFSTDELGKKWGSDITYIKVKSNWMYLTTMIDLADRKVVGWSLSDDMTVGNTVLKAWYSAIKNRDIADGFLLHSDRGVQYRSCNKRNGSYFYI